MVSRTYKFERLCVCPLWEFKDGIICPQSPWFTEVLLSVGLVQWLIIHSLKGWLVRKTEFPFPEHQKKTKYKRTWGVDLVSFSTRRCKKGKVILWALYSPFTLHRWMIFQHRFIFMADAIKSGQNLLIFRIFCKMIGEKQRFTKGLPFKRVGVAYGLISNSSLP